MRSRRRSSTAVLTAAALLLMGAGSVTATLGAQRSVEDGRILFSALGADAFRLSVAASTDSTWYPAAGDWWGGRGEKHVVPLTADSRPFELHPGDSALLYVFVRNSSPLLSGEVKLSVLPPAQRPDQDELFGQLSIHGSVGGRTIFDGRGRVGGEVVSTLGPGQVRRIALTISLPPDAPSSVLDRTTGVLLSVSAENR